MTKGKRQVIESYIHCDYCSAPAILVSGDSIYPHRPDLHAKKFWRCAPCDAYVGVHESSRNDTPLGRLANSELRRAKIAAHAAFDPLWQAKIRRDGCSKKEARSAGYKWLAEQLGIPVRNCHVGHFDVAMCERVVKVIEERVN